MRDFRDAKAMAHSLRHALKAKAVDTTHGECLELIAKAFGYDNWNVLSAKVEAAEPRTLTDIARSRAGAPPPPPPKILYCSFCGKSQHDVRKLIAGPRVYICDECVDLCTDIVGDIDHEQLLRFLQGNAEGARAMSTEELAHYVDHGRKGADRCRLALTYIERRLETPDRDTPLDNDTLTMPRFAYLKDRSPEELAVMLNSLQQQLKLYEDALHMATRALGERRQQTLGRP
jgi:hypothetical protein